MGTFPEPPAPTDLVITKRQWGAFHGTELDLQLRRRGIRCIVLGGIATNIGVESTARAALELGYELVIAEDMCGGRRGDARVRLQVHLPAAWRASRHRGDRARMNAAPVRRRGPGVRGRRRAWAGLLAVSALPAGRGAPRLPAAPAHRADDRGHRARRERRDLDVPRWSYLGAQAVIGALVAAVHAPAILARFSQDAFALRAPPSA